MTELSTEKMAEIGRDFVHSVRLLKEAGCDGAELHCAHGSFLNAVHSPIENTRQDRYGGDLEGRLTLLKEIIEGCRECIDDSFILSCRMGWTETLEGDIALAQAMEKLGVEMLHVSGGIPADRSLDIPADFPYNAFVYTGTRVKQHVNIPVTVVNDLQNTGAGGNELLREDACDLIAYGRPFLADPDFGASRGGGPGLYWLPEMQGMPVPHRRRPLSRAAGEKIGRIHYINIKTTACRGFLPCYIIVSNFLCRSRIYAFCFFFRGRRK